MELTQTPQEVEERRLNLIALYKKKEDKVKNKEKYERTKDTRVNYYINNREEILAKKKAYDDKRLNDGTYLMPIKCSCGASYFYKSKARHFKTKKHRVNMLENRINDK